MPRRWAGGRISPNGQYGKPSRSSAETSSLRFDVGRPDHLAPLLCFFADELAEVGGQARKRRRREIAGASTMLSPGDAATCSTKAREVSDRSASTITTLSPRITR